METLLLLIGIAGLSQALTWAKPFRMILNVFNLDDKEPVCHPNVKQTSYDFYCNAETIWTFLDGHLHMFLRELLSCSICISFWIGLFATGDLWLAGVVMILTKMVDWLHAVAPTKIDLD